MANATVLSYRRSPAGDRHEQMAAASNERVALKEVPFQTQIGLRAELGSEAAQALENLFGAGLPERVGHVVPVQQPVPGQLLWLGPDDFLLVAADEAELDLSSAELAAELAKTIGTHRGQAVELTANRTVLELSGPHATDVLYKMVEVDVHPDVFAVDTAILTLVAGSSVVLWRTAAETWWLLPRASFTPHTVNWLLDAMREYV
ncbi:sarcosine oxidase subunit gamma [Micrococcoides hystricis]|uniref:Sarcosine oxidase subunit gamma n=1 Tax=Micrococcoides hystricis TaxID=1572761 RepID=A0ABV6P9U4_9MICC